MAESDQRNCRAGTLVDGNGHICAFFNSREEARRTLLPFIADGLEKGEKAVHIVNANDRDEHLRWLRESQIDVGKLMQSGQLEVLTWPETYLRGGAFREQDAIKMIDQLLTRARREGYPRVRGIGDMQWTRENRMGVEDVMEYEAQLNSIIAGNGDILVCAYDLTRFSGTEIIGVIRTHPAAVIGGVLQQNPFFVPPEQVLAELRERTHLPRSREERA